MKASVGCVSQRTNYPELKVIILYISTNGALANAPYINNFFDKRLKKSEPK